MIAYLVTDLESPGRTVSDQDLRQLRKWAHNHIGVLHRAAQASSGVSAVEDCPPPRGSTSQIAGGAKKKAKTSAVLPCLVSLLQRRLFGHAAWLYRGVTVRRAGVLSCRQELFLLRRAVNWTPPVPS